MRRSSDSYMQGLQPNAELLPSQVPPVTDFRQKKFAVYIQRRYRSGITPDYLVQQQRFGAPAATQRIIKLSWVL